MYHPASRPLALLAGVLGFCLLPVSLVPVSQAHMMADPESLGDAVLAAAPPPMTS